MRVVNPSWPGSKHMAHGGPAFGLRANDGEGYGFGRCIAILAGGPAGGHQSAVLCAVSIEDLIFMKSMMIELLQNFQAFHPSAPLIATSGVRTYFQHMCLALMSFIDGPYG